MKIRNLTMAAASLALSTAAMADVTTKINHANGGHTTVTTNKSGTRAERNGGASGSSNRGGRNAATHVDMVREHTGPGDKAGKPEHTNKPDKANKAQ